MRVDFPVDAAEWLKPLLSRFEQQRQMLVKSSNNRYLIVSGKKAHRMIPIGQTTLTNLVEDASLQALGMICCPQLLRQTAGVLFADHAGWAVLRFMGWSEQRAIHYTLVEREIVHPREVKQVCK